MNPTGRLPPVRRMAGRLVPFAAVFLSVGLLGACVVSPAGPYYGRGPGVYGGGAYVTVAPPAPRVEVVGVAPAPGYFWISGFWNWEGERHSWVPGRWEAPREGYRYEPHRWEQEGGGWHLRPGRWEESRGEHEREHEHEHERGREHGRD